MGAKGMSSLNEDDVRRIAREEMSNVLDEFYGTLADRLIRKFKSLPQATDTDTLANQEASESPAEEDNTPPCVERRKTPYWPPRKPVWRR